MILFLPLVAALVAMPMMAVRDGVVVAAEARACQVGAPPARTP